MSAFKYRVHVGWDDEDRIYVARVPALPGCAAHGASAAEAVAEVEVAAREILSVMEAHGDPLPSEEGEPSHSGNIRLRLPRTLHAHLDALASAEGVSLNQLMVWLLAAGASAGITTASPRPQPHLRGLVVREEVGTRPGDSSPKGTKSGVRGTRRRRPGSGQ